MTLAGCPNPGSKEGATSGESVRARQRRVVSVQMKVHVRRLKVLTERESIGDLARTWEGCMISNVWHAFHAGAGDVERAQPLTLVLEMQVEPQRFWFTLVYVVYLVIYDSG